MNFPCRLLLGLGMVAGLASSPSHAYDDYADYDSNGFDLGLGVTGGTLGLGLEASTKLNSMLVLRLIGTGLAWDYEGSSSGVDYNWDADIRSFGAVADLHPFGNGFRLSAGIRYLDLQFDGAASYAFSYQLGDTSYLSADIGGLRATSNISQWAPYLGVGFDSTHYGSALSFGIDVGALYVGDSNVRFSTDRSVPGLAEDLAREAQDVKNDSAFNDFYPVVMLSLKYRF